MATMAELLRLQGGAFVGYPQMPNKTMPQPQGGYAEGFLSSATGIPQQPNMSVLDPNQAAYLKGRQAGEPVGIAAMALPFAAPAAVATAKALAPKAGQMAENYMINQGFMPSLIAYHGTPHTIKGKFDISKVGTGEGAQAYGHGMYFAENPAVAKEYQKMLRGPESTAQHYLDLYKTPESAISAIQYEIKPNLTAEAKKHSLDAIEVLKSGKELKGNLYKVDIPDADIPNMLDWDKPFSEQSKTVQKSIVSDPSFNEYVNNIMGKPITSLSGKDIQKMRLGYEADLSKSTQDVSAKATNWFKNSGISGIRYLDEGSRGAGGGTSNFVVFEPSQVKILEQNSKPLTRKEILEQELKKVVE
jgi:hypothetical protein